MTTCKGSICFPTRSGRRASRMTRLYMLFSSLLAVWLNHLHQPTTVVLMWCVQMCVHVCVCVFLAIQQYNSLPLVSLAPLSPSHTFESCSGKSCRPLPQRALARPMFANKQGGGCGQRLGGRQSRTRGKQVPTYPLCIFFVAAVQIGEVALVQALPDSHADSS